MKKIVLIGYTCAKRKAIEEGFDAMICPPGDREKNVCPSESLRRCRKVTVIVKKGWGKK